MATAQTVAIAGRGPRIPAISLIGFALIWAFLILFVLYPLLRIFYDAITNEAGQFTFANLAGKGSSADFRAVNIFCNFRM